MNTLVVEDEFISRKILTKILSDYSNVDIATDGQEAIDAFILAHQNNEPYHLILLDIMMPEKNGQEVLKEIRDYEKTHNIYYNQVKIVMTTASSDRKNIMEAFRSQCEGYLVKPIIPNKLIDKIKELGFSMEKIV